MLATLVLASLVLASLVLAALVLAALVLASLALATGTYAICVASVTSPFTEYMRSEMKEGRASCGQHELWWGVG
jgi:hypothetical protein